MPALSRNKNRAASRSRWLTKRSRMARRDAESGQSRDLQLAAPAAWLRSGLQRPAASGACSFGCGRGTGSCCTVYCILKSAFAVGLKRKRGLVYRCKASAAAGTLWSRLPWLAGFNRGFCLAGYRGLRCEHAQELVAGQSDLSIKPLDGGGFDSGKQPPQYLSQQHLGDLAVAMLRMNRGQRHFQQCRGLQHASGERLERRSGTRRRRTVTK